VRFKLLMRGLLFYNTVYWNRASDGLNPPKLSSIERELYAPPLDHDVIKPRGNPRAHIEIRAKPREIARTSSLPTAGQPVPGAPDARRVTVRPMATFKRRRRQHRNPTISPVSPPKESTGVFARLLGR